MCDYPVFNHRGELPANTVWNIPESPVNEVRGDMKHSGPWQIVTGYRALAIDMHGRVYGMRSLSNPRESGYVLEGSVSIDGHKYRAFTSSKLFHRTDGSLCEVATLHVCGTPDGVWSDPLLLADGDSPTLYREYLSELTSRYHYEREGTDADLCRYATCLQRIADGWAAKYPYCETENEARELRAKLAPIMGWEVVPEVSPCR